MASYSDYAEDLIRGEHAENRRRMLAILHEESRILETVKLTGTESLPESQRTVLSKAKIIRETFLQQNAYDPVDTFTLPYKQAEMMKGLL